MSSEPRPYSMFSAITAANVNQAKGNIDGKRQAYTIGANDQIYASSDYKPVIIAWSKTRGLVSGEPLKDFVAAVSVGMVAGIPVLDLDYEEDADCDTDMNVVMTGAGGFIEVQGTAEGVAFFRTELDTLVTLAESGIRELIAEQKRSLGDRNLAR